MKLSKYALLAGLAAAREEVADDTCIRNGKEVDCTINPRGVMDTSASDDIDDREDRRYIDLAEMNYKQWKVNGAKGEWDERKYWGYGCHCFMVGDRPMTEMGFGIPVDGLDSACRQWKECQMCTRQNHGEQCIGEFVKYTWKFRKDAADFEILNDAGSCARELGECDRKFVIDTFAQRRLYDEKFNYFYGGFDRQDKDENCPPAGGNVVVHECCGGHKIHWTWMGTKKKQCCVNPKDKREQYVEADDVECSF